MKPNCPLLRNSRDMRHSGCLPRYVPLTLTLSLREREQRASDSCLANSCWPNSDTGVTERRWTILPLPWGEGRGECKANVAEITVQSVNQRSQRHSTQRGGFADGIQIARRFLFAFIGLIG